MSHQIQQDSTSVIQYLGYAGLLPFLGFALLAMIQSVNYIPLMLFCYYSTAILAFLAGSVWRHESQIPSLLIQSNAIVLLAVLAITSFHLQPVFCLLLLALGYSWVLIIDLNSSDYEHWYKTLRLTLSLVVMSLHAALVFFV